MTRDEAVFTNVYMAQPPTRVKTVPQSYREAYEAIQAAEEWLRSFGTKGKSRVDVFLNGDRHSVVTWLPEDRFGLFNEPVAEFPVFYVDTNGRELTPDEFDIFKLDESAAEPEQGEGGDEESENEGDGESEAPRVRLFARIKGNGYTRKRFQSDMRRGRNIFRMTIGRLPDWYNEDEDRQTQRQERDVIASVEFLETEQDKETGLLKVRFQRRMGHVPATLNMTETHPERGLYVFDVELQPHPRS